MDKAQKKRIIRLFLQTNSDVLINDDALKAYHTIEDCLDQIEAVKPTFFDIETLETNPEKMQILIDILERAVTFGEGSPPEIINIDSDIINSRIKFWQRYQDISELPGCDYYNRQTAIVADKGVDELIVQSREALKPILLECFPDFNLSNQMETEKKIISIKKELDIAVPGSSEQRLAMQKLAILQDLRNINTLTTLSIPRETRSASLYCTLSQSVGGVTEKVSLIRRDEAVKQLSNLVSSAPLSLERYSEQRDQYNLNPEAILKLPKHGDPKEVQREAMALNISRMLGIETTNSTMVTHQGKPALFVPFDTISLLNEVSTGKTQTRLFSSATYTHYSILNPVGSGLQPDEFIEDFGHAFGLLYLCNDTDALGGYGQNKALKGNNLFIFDQVIMDQEKLGLDSRLCLQPIQFLLMHTRHGQGRNRTLIEDSSMDKKFESLMQLRREQPKLLLYFSRVANIHNQQLKTLEIALSKAGTTQERTELKTQIKLVQTLKKDAEILQEKIKERIQNINTILPKTSKDIDDILIRQTLILEKTLNMPVLFTNDGRPYRNPWTQRNTIHATKITTVEGQPNQICITFDKPIHKDVILMLRRQLGTSTPIKTGTKELIIQEKHLRALNEISMFPEHRSNLNAAQNYLRTIDLDLIKQGYGEGLHGQIIQATREYLDTMSNDHLSLDYKLQQIRATEGTIKGLIDQAKDKGFGMQVLKRFYFDAQQKLQAMMTPEQRPAQLNEAFSAALKLDQICQFNTVVQEAIKQDKLTDPIFIDFLNECIDKANQATDHFKAKDLSLKLEDSAKTAVQQLQQEKHLDQPPTLARLLRVGEDEPDILEGIDPENEQFLSLEHEALILREALANAPPVLEPIDSSIKKDVTIKV